MTLPLPDLTGVVNAIKDNTVQLKRIADQLDIMNEDTDTKMQERVDSIRNALENQYRETIENLEKRLPNHGHTFPFIEGPINNTFGGVKDGGSGGIGSAPNPESL